MADATAKSDSNRVGTVDDCRDDRNAMQNPSAYCVLAASDTA
jgi:hypothetical protein